MGKVNAGKITINLEAGTAQFVLDLDKANKKLNETGAHAVSAQQATSGALRTLEGNFNNNLRAAENFIAKTLGLGPILQKAFPVIGGIAFLGMLGELIGKVGEFKQKLTDLAEAPARIANKFRELNTPLQKTNDELAVSNARLSNEIAKLEGKPQNGLALGLAEAKVAADNLEDSLLKDLAALGKLLKEENVGAFAKIFGGQEGTSDIEKRVKEYSDQIRDVADAGNEKIHSAKTQDDQKAARTELQVALTKKYAEAQKYLNDEIQKSVSIEAQRNKSRDGAAIISSPYGPVQSYGNNGTHDQTSRLAVLRSVQRNFRELGDYSGLEYSNEQLTGRRDADAAAKANAAIGKPFRDATNEQNARLEASQQKLRQSGIAFNEVGKAAAEAYGRATEKITQLNDAADKNHQLTLKQKADYLGTETRIGMTDLQASLKDKALADQTKLLDLNRQMYGVIEQENAERDETLKTINAEIDAARKLAAAEGKGADGVYAAQRDLKLAGIKDDAVRAATGQLDDEKRAAEIRKQVEGIDMQREATERLAAAQNQGEAARRNAAMENIAASGESLDIIKAQQAALQAQFDMQDALELRNATARQGMQAYFSEMADQARSAGRQIHDAMAGAVDGINESLSRIMSGQKAGWGQMFQGLSQQLAKSGLQNIEAGVGKKLGSIFNKDQQNGGGGVWNEQAPGILGKLGGMLGLGGGKRDGSTEGSALYVAVVGSKDGAAGAGSTLAGGLINKLAGGATSGDSDDSSGGGGGFGGFLGSVVGGLFGGFRAGGGDVDPGKAYVVGEKGPEIFTPPSTGGSIVPNHKLGGSTNYYNIDATGAEAAAVEQRVQKALVAVHGSAVRSSAAVQSEMARRKPKG